MDIETLTVNLGKHEFSIGLVRYISLRGLYIVEVSALTLDLSSVQRLSSLLSTNAA